MGVPENFRSKYPSLINDQYLKTWNNWQPEIIGVRKKILSFSLCWTKKSMHSKGIRKTQEWNYELFLHKKTTSCCAGGKA
jgi:hypothetical protein